MSSTKGLRNATGVGALLATALASGAAPIVPTYEARYEVEYKGRDVGESVHSLQYDAASGVYRFESVTSAQGIAKLLRPREVVEQSEFVVDADAIRPLRFSYTDGTRKGDDNFSIAFDWQAGEARAETADDGSVQALTPGVLDRATLQVALMADLADGGELGPHLMLDEESVKTYTYVRDGEETIETPSGRHQTVKVTQQREGSSRQTIIWAAPALDFLPVRIEQRRDGETLTALTLVSVEGIPAAR